MELCHRFGSLIPILSRAAAGRIENDVLIIDHAAVEHGPRKNPRMRIPLSGTHRHIRYVDSVVVHVVFDFNFCAVELFDLRFVQIVERLNPTLRHEILPVAVLIEIDVGKFSARGQIGGNAGLKVIVLYQLYLYPGICGLEFRGRGLHPCGAESADIIADFQRIFVSVFSRRTTREKSCRTRDSQCRS